MTQGRLRDKSQFVWYDFDKLSQNTLIEVQVAKNLSNSHRPHTLLYESCMDVVDDQYHFVHLPCWLQDRVVENNFAEDS